MRSARSKMLTHQMSRLLGSDNVGSPPHVLVSEHDDAALQATYRLQSPLTF